MKHFILLLCLLVVSVLPAPESYYQTEFLTFMKNHGKSYSQKEFMQRYHIFRKNLEFIDKHNAGNHTFTLSVNRFADMTNEEFRKRNGYNMSAEVQLQEGKLFKKKKTSLPDSLDWRKKGAVTEVKDQGDCGSCWSFSTTGSTEGCNFLKTKKLVSLSEQNLIDCSSPYGNQGCDGGLMTNAMDYIIANLGIDTENSYPYETEDGSCSFSKRNIGAVLKSYQNIPEGDEDALQQAVAKGPTSVAIDASHSSFQFYSKGIYNEPNCSPVDLDHGVLVVGWGTNEDGDYWIVKNSWGLNWGENGYILMARNKNNMCGIATSATLPKC